MAEARKPSRTERERRNEMFAILERFEWDMARRATLEDRLPAEWRSIWEERSRKKVKMSFWIEEDVVKFYRSLGPGHGPRMNRVLRSFMLARLGGLIEGEDLLEKYRERWMGKPKPSAGEAVAMFEEVDRRSGG